MFLADMFNKKTAMPKAQDALPGRAEPLPVGDSHFVTGISMKEPFPENMEIVMFAMGCFWGVERLFWNLPGVYVTSVGYAGGTTPNPTYQETVTGLTGHAEVVRIVFDPSKIRFDALLKIFWEEHDPTQGMRQGNDIGTTYRSAIYTTTDAQMEEAQRSREAYQQALTSAGRGSKITTELRAAPEYFFAEEYHQQYLAKNPGGYCGLKGTGVSCPVPNGVSAGNPST